MKRILFALMALVCLTAPAAAAGIDDAINSATAPIAAMIGKIVFFKVEMFGAQLPLVVLWLVVGAVFFTLYLGFINLRGFRHAIALLRGHYGAIGEGPGEVSHFQALVDGGLGHRRHRKHRRRGGGRFGRRSGRGLLDGRRRVCSACRPSSWSARLGVIYRRRARGRELCRVAPCTTWLAKAFRRARHSRRIRSRPSASFYAIGHRDWLRSASATCSSRTRPIVQIVNV